MNSLVLAVSQSSANTAEWAASLLAFIVAGAGVWRFAIKQGRRQAEEAVEQAALKKIVDADLVNSVSGLHDIAGKLDAHAEKLDAHLKQVDEGGK